MLIVMVWIAELVEDSELQNRKFLEGMSFDLYIEHLAFGLTPRCGLLIDQPGCISVQKYRIGPDTLAISRNKDKQFLSTPMAARL